ncbi:MAG: type VI secretion system contractile sheath large subunit [Desulfohalobiaceae bacterium]|nr:type VI secretion system contractile sheath large subunit [Desulfohalobiaceae bacterium]
MHNYYFSLYVLSSFGLSAKTKTRFFEVDPFDLKASLQEQEVAVQIPLDEKLCPAHSLKVCPRTITDFQPDGLIRSNSYLRSLKEALDYLQQAGSEGIDPLTVYNRLIDWPELNLSISPPQTDSRIQGTNAGRREDPGIDAILSMVAGTGTQKSGPAHYFETWSGHIRDLLAANIKHIFADPYFRKVEAAWRGLDLLSKRAGKAGNLKIICLDLDLDNALEILSDQASFQGLHPPGLLLLDLPLDNSGLSLQIMKQLGQTAEALLCPAAFWLTETFFYLNDWAEIKKLQYIRHHLEDQVYAKFNGLRRSEAGNWLLALCNPFLARVRYSPDSWNRTVSFREQEELWLGPVWALGALIAESLAISGFPSRFTDHRSIKLDNLSLSGLDKPLATQAAFTRDRGRELAEAGLIPLETQPGQDTAFLTQERTLSGGSFARQLLLAYVIGFFLHLRDTADPLEVSKEEAIKNRFSEFWRLSEQEAPRDLQLSLTAAGDDQVLYCSFTPGPQVLPRGEAITFEIRW